jgi:hypothetical protein
MQAGEIIPQLAAKLWFLSLQGPNGAYSHQPRSTKRGQIFVTESTQANNFQQEIGNYITERNNSNSHQFSITPALDHFLDSPCEEAQRTKRM